jgi:hypothetical protein
VFGRVLTPGELAGFAPQGRRVLGVNAASWVAEQGLPPAERVSEAARLERLGFVAGVRERLLPKAGGPGEAISIVELFGSPRAARANVRTEARTLARGAGAELRPLLIPGGKASGGSSGGSTKVNLVFAKGAYFYLMGAHYPTGTPNAPNLFDIILAGNHLYARVPG